MRDYFLRRILLIPPTLIGVTLIVFAITRFVPGGPMERAIMEAQIADASQGGGGSGGARGGEGTGLSEDQLNELKAYYGFDKPMIVAYFSWLGKLVRGDLGVSTRYQDSVWSQISQRFPISIFYGLTTMIITYGICIPLGMLKALKHRTALDTYSSILVFCGYAIPGYALGSLLLLFFSVELGWFPMGGFKSIYFEELSLWEKAVDIVDHAVLPLICYLVGSFAVTTLLMKNHLMDNMAADYMRTAVAKGVSFKSAVFHHALRNSMIPIATTFGQNVSLILTGSFLIETIFDIDGIGLLGISAVLDRDYPVVMGIVFLSSLLLLLGNVISDALVALVDPRIRFK
ncbi:ABC transporter permease [Pelagicoccus sp. SDUM812005]|uniref:ABC transporter permease n=1 Tax=Pelagicoccus sp. SDUM812005 TaxID=3041257 RepID=UPI00280F70EC|nr:ABC transporter permease [Pelagicoccus sp. SDUM812005]MDQ8182304.1 ABC transporter permease [Pelagicoccus sp. SDUM812005]